MVPPVAETAPGGVPPGGTGAIGVAAPPARRVVRLSGTDLCPRWRGRLHLGALLLAAPAAVALVARRPSLAVGVYAGGLVAVFAVSSGYHMLPLSARGRRAMRQVDHAMIYLFIAASYTPFCSLAVPGRLGIAVLGVAWLGAAAGMVIKVVGFDRAQRAGSVLYLAVGWLAVVTAPDAIRSLDQVELGLLVATGLFYTVGAAMLFARRPDPFPHSFGYHEMWHSAVVLAAAAYYLLVWDLVR